MEDIMLEEVEPATTELGTNTLLRIFKEIWEHIVICMEWKHSVIIPILKKKNKLDCSYYRDITLFCHSSKIFSFIFLQRLKGRTEEILAEA